MKTWPNDDTVTVDFSKLINPIVKVLQFGYEMKRKNEDKNILYDGYNTEREEQVTCFSPEEVFMEKHLKFILENQGRTLLEEALTIVFQLGAAQGRRMLRNKMKNSMKLMRKMLEQNTKKELMKEILSYFEIIEHNFRSLDRFCREEKDI